MWDKAGFPCPDAPGGRPWAGLVGSGGLGVGRKGGYAQGVTTVPVVPGMCSWATAPGTRGTKGTSRTSGRVRQEECAMYNTGNVNVAPIAPSFASIAGTHPELEVRGEEFGEKHVGG